MGRNFDNIERGAIKRTLAHTLLTENQKEFVEEVFLAILFTADEDRVEDYSPHFDGELEHFVAEGVEALSSHIVAFYEQATALGIMCPGEDNDLAQYAHDFWFTAQGHGVGYWDEAQGYKFSTELDNLVTSKFSYLEDVRVYSERANTIELDGLYERGEIDVRKA